MQWNDSVAFAPHLHVRRTEASVSFVGGRPPVTLTWPSVSLLCVEIARCRRLIEIVDALTGYVTPEECWAMVAAMAKAGLVELRDLKPQGPPAAIRRAKGRTPVRFVGLSQDHDEFVRAAEASGLVHEESARMQVVLADSPFCSEVHRRLREVAEFERPWLLATVLGNDLFCGTPIVPKSVFRFREGIDRLRENIWIEDADLDRLGESLQDPRASVPSRTQIARLLSVVIRSMASFDRNCGRETLYVVHRSKRITAMPLARFIPRESPTGRQTNLSQARSPLSGELRVYRPSCTFMRLRRTVNPYLGLVHSIEDHSSTIDSVFLYGAISNLSASPKAAVDETRGAMFGFGRGSSRIEAKLTALGEGVERICCHLHYKGELVRSSYSSLGPRAVHPNDIQLFSDRQYKLRKAGADPRLFVPERYNDEVIEWVKGQCLDDLREVFVPASTCYYGYKDPSGHCHGVADSSGVALGSTREEALLHGFLELAERDAVSIWWYNRRSGLALNLSESDDPQIIQTISAHAKASRKILAWRIDNDLQLPVCASMSYDIHRIEAPIFGFGCHINTVNALKRSLGELNQKLPSIYASERAVSVEDALIAAFYTSEMADSLINGHKNSMEPLSDRFYFQDTAEALRHVLKGFYKACLRPIYVDMSIPGARSNVIRCFAPGVRHLWPRFAPGRIYSGFPHGSEPFEACLEDGLNPIPMLFC